MADPSSAPDGATEGKLSSIKHELLSPAGPIPGVDLAKVMATRREKAVGEDEARARRRVQPAAVAGSGSVGERELFANLTLEQRLALLGISAEELRSVLKKGEG